CLCQCRIRCVLLLVDSRRSIALALRWPSFLFYFLIMITSIFRFN
uniref:Thioredoxin domain-containing protein n=1 Tax=Parascaris univalens TaxID=6257 RepID=A0A915C9K0_PARUN